MNCFTATIALAFLIGLVVAGFPLVAALPLIGDLLTWQVIAEFIVVSFIVVVPLYVLHCWIRHAPAKQQSVEDDDEEDECDGGPPPLSTGARLCITTLSEAHKTALSRWKASHLDLIEQEKKSSESF